MPTRKPPTAASTVNCGHSGARVARTALCWLCWMATEEGKTWQQQFDREMAKHYNYKGKGEKMTTTTSEVTDQMDRRGLGPDNPKSLATANGL